MSTVILNLVFPWWSKQSAYWLLADRKHLSAVISSWRLQSIVLSVLKLQELSIMDQWSAFIPVRHNRNISVHIKWTDIDWDPSSHIVSQSSVVLLALLSIEVHIPRICSRWALLDEELMPNVISNARNDLVSPNGHLSHAEANEDSMHGGTFGTSTLVTQILWIVVMTQFYCGKESHIAVDA